MFKSKKVFICSLKVFLLGRRFWVYCRGKQEKGVFNPRFDFRVKYRYSGNLPEVIFGLCWWRHELWRNKIRIFRKNQMNEEERRRARIDQLILKDLDFGSFEKSSLSDQALTDICSQRQSLSVQSFSSRRKSSSRKSSAQSISIIHTPHTIRFNDLIWPWMIFNHNLK